MHSNSVLPPRQERVAVTTLANDPLASNVTREAMRLVALLSVLHAHRLGQQGFVQIEDRVWFECDFNDEGSFFVFTLDPLDGEEKGTIKTLTLQARTTRRGRSDIDLLTTDQEDLFWWAIWLADFFTSQKLKNNEPGGGEW
jgi:hypothetical protein